MPSRYLLDHHRRCPLRLSEAIAPSKKTCGRGQRLQRLCTNGHIIVAAAPCDLAKRLHIQAGGSGDIAIAGTFYDCSR
jgi:hypothetical protein